MVTLTNVGANYDTTQAARGLGIGLIDFRGATHVRFVVYHQKVGSGTITYQLWNMDDGTIIALAGGGAEGVAVADNQAAAVRVLDQTFQITPIAGIKLCRVRAKSSVSSDDPIFLGAAGIPFVQ